MNPDNNMPKHLPNQYVPDFKVNFINPSSRNW